MEDIRSIEYSKDAHPICDVSVIAVDVVAVNFYASDEEYESHTEESNEESSDDDLLPGMFPGGSGWNFKLTTSIDVSEDKECFRTMKNDWNREMKSIRSLSILIDSLRPNYDDDDDDDSVVPELEDDGITASPQTISINGVENSMIDRIYMEPISVRNSCSYYRKKYQYLFLPYSLQETVRFSDDSRNSRSISCIKPQTPQT
ncbi:hypothetical protein M422DRAFT_51161 [Sphaerobolus stellatus SS14]|uniref:Uncharacterized protein n=1 Tax=Sphaerobolus stellatus (strain SS14) TaxID=990650 RepID=A0A0C9V3C3_SPHS4|nr:hypothetical protein M422DRAFT_51161 [Sphaerobolus stellatus SS14]